MLVAAILLAGVAGAAGCDGGKSAVREPGPKDVLARLIELRARRDYSQMVELIVPERGPAVTNLLLAVDEFTAANARLRDYLRDHVDPGLSLQLDCGRMVQNLEIFSQYVTLMDETISGDEATVSFVVDEQLPAEHARLRRVGGAWRYDPGAGSPEEFPAAFRRLARGLDQMYEELESGRLPPEVARRNPERVAESLRVYLVPGMRMLPNRGAATQPGGRP